MPFEKKNSIDPTINRFLEHHRQESAWKSFNLTFIMVGFIGVPVFIILGHIILQPEVAPSSLHDPFLQFLDRFAGSFELAIWMSLLGTLLLSCLGFFLKPYGNSACTEPWYGAIVAFLLYAFFYDPLIGLSILTALLLFAYATSTFFRAVALLFGGAKSIDIQRDEIEANSNWPVYTVLVPLYKEAGIAESAVKHLGLLDYPEEKLDIIFLLEEDDNETRHALDNCELPSYMRVLVVPDAQPKTKPRACNHGLLEAKGDFLVIYDAEDRPEPDQLKKAVIAFQQCPDYVACLQAYLAFHNNKQNKLTDLFAMEYNTWFTRYLPGLSALHSPIPLGGTSNHFRMKVLKELEGWDPFNVTEDCDLGIRLTVAGYKTGLLHSTTWEEANSQVGNWIRQRSRWIKGYMQTHFVWTRQPIRMLKLLGLWKCLCLWTAVGSVAILPLLNPFLWILLFYYIIVLIIDIQNGHELWYLLSERSFYDDRLSWPLIYAGPGEDPVWSLLSILFFAVSLLLLCANALFIGSFVFFGRRDDQGHSILTAIFGTPFYWLLMSFAAWKGAWQLLWRPHYWEKTIHGLDSEFTPQHREEHQ